MTRIVFRMLLVSTVGLWSCVGDPGATGADAGADVDADSDADGDADGDSGSDEHGPLKAVIVSPADGAEFPEGSLIDFSGAAQGGVPPYDFQWSFGELGGGSLEQDPGPVRLGEVGKYWCTLTVTDAEGEQDSSTAGIDATPLQGEMSFYFGNLHSHSGLSDGEGTPSEAFAFARDEADLDFYAITDHSEMLFGGEFEEVGTQADLFNEPGVFVALRGFEWSHPINGHMCIYKTDSYTAAYTSIWINFIYDWIEDNDGIAQFNHPGREIGVFNNLALEPDMLDNVFAIETGNKGDGVNDGEFLPYYVQALDNGWRVAPTNNQDNHTLSVNSHRTVFVGEDLSRGGLLEAIGSRRLYSTDDPDMEVVFKHGDAWMGEEVTAQGNTMKFSVKVNDDEPIAGLRIVSNGGSTAAQYEPFEEATSVLWEPEVTVGSSTYFFMEVTEVDLHDDDGPMQMAVTAPIWVD